MKAYAIYIFGIFSFLWICYSSASKECDTVPAEYKELCQARVRKYYNLKNRFHEECCENDLMINPRSNCSECDLWASNQAAQAIRSEQNEQLDDNDDDSNMPVEIDTRVSLGGRRRNRFKWE